MSTLRTINLQHPTAATANITLSNTGGIALNGSVSGGGMDLITPTSVVGATLSGGEVNFSAATSVSINGCFTTTYDAYRIVTKLSQSADSTIAMRMRLAGTDATGANYDFEAFLAAGATTTAGRVLTATSMNFAYASIDSFINIDMHGPALAATTYLLGSAYYGPGVTFTQHVARHAVSTAYDGLTIIPGSGNITGKLRIYGLRNS